MNNDLEQFSEESLKELIEHINQLPDANGKAQFAALARIALAAKQAKPVGYFRQMTCGMYYQLSKSTATMDQIPLYTTPPANSPAIPDGWKLVPIEPTIGMLANGVIAGISASPDPWCPHVWEAMLAAAPKPESE